MQGDSLIFFPPPTVEASLLLASGVGADPPWGPGEGGLDGGEGWGASSRSSVQVEGMFVWTGGTMSGNARVSKERMCDLERRPRSVKRIYRVCVAQ